MITITTKTEIIQNIQRLEKMMSNLDLSDSYQYSFYIVLKKNLESFNEHLYSIGVSK